MNRRDFLKTSAALLTLGVLGCQKKTGIVVEKAEEKGQMTCRKFPGLDPRVSLLGFGLMRLPRSGPGPEIDKEKASSLIDLAMKNGVTYYDTAWMYHSGLSERFAGEALKKYPRESFFLADKLPHWEAKDEAEALKIFEEQLNRCQTEYFDFYLIHSLNGGSWPHARDEGPLSMAEKEKEKGRIKYLGFSFHGENKDFPDIIKYRKWDFVQIQANYYDWDDYAGELYQIATDAGIPVVIMEPLRGGELANVLPQTKAIFEKAKPGSTPAEWAFRYIASLPNVLTVLSGMNEKFQLEENLKTFSPLKELSEAEKGTIKEALAMIKDEGKVPCTACRYCMPCPVGVAIPDVFKIYNEYRSTLVKWKSAREYQKLPEESRATACVGCQACVSKCPQKINIPEELKRAHAELTAS